MSLHTEYQSITNDGTHGVATPNRNTIHITNGNNQHFSIVYYHGTINNS